MCLLNFFTIAPFSPPSGGTSMDNTQVTWTQKPRTLHHRSKSAIKSGLVVYIATYPDLIGDFIRTSSNDMTEKTRNSGIRPRKFACRPRRSASNFAPQNCAPLPWPRIKPPAGPPLTCFGFMSLCKQASTRHGASNFATQNCNQAHVMVPAILLRKIARHFLGLG